MVRRLREWWNGKDVRVDPNEPDNIGGMGVIPNTVNVKSQTSKAAYRFVDWHARNWIPFWGLVITAIGVLIAYLALK